MNKLKIILCLFLLCLTLTSFSSTVDFKEGHETSEKNEHKGSSLNVKEIVLGHMSDAYEWHLFTWNGHHVSIPLLVIVKSESTGWHIFPSTHISEGKSYEGFIVNHEDGKLYESFGPEKLVKPLDLSITKNVLQLWITVIILLSIFLSCSHWYKKKKPEDEAPKGMVGLMEMFVMGIVDDVIRPSVGEKYYKFYTPYLLTVFFFILVLNLLGMMPIFPGGANVTGNITVTFLLAIFTFIAVNVFGNKVYWKDIFWPNVPLWLKFPLPIMPIIEIFGIFTKPFALMVRLFANMMSGHAIVLSLVTIIFITCEAGAVLGSTLSPVSLLLTIFMDCLEILVDFIQAYVFTMLSSVFIGLAHPEEECE